MRAGGSKSKGSSFERVVAKLIITAGEDLGFTKRDVYRTPLSGGHVFAKHKHPSDLVMTKKVLRVFPASIECKHYKKFELQNLWTRQGLLFDWIDQALRATEGTRVNPVVVFKWNLSKIFCVFEAGKFRITTNTYMQFRFRKKYWNVILFTNLLRGVFDCGRKL